MKNITVIGAGYVGLANSFMMGIDKKITLIDINEEKINMLKNGISPINDEYISKYISRVNVKYTTNQEEAYKDADVIFVATDTNYDEQLNKFDLRSIEGALSDVNKYAKDGTIIVIKSTIPIGYTDSLKQKYPKYKILFSPEFLREGFALYDNLNPDRIIVGGKENIEESQYVADLLKSNTETPYVPVIHTTNEEAEVIKLFANTYLAMRVSFVNELDTYCQSKGMQTANVLDGIGYDSRIGRDYFNPSFGYGGYCLPKDTKQLKSEYTKSNIEQTLIGAIVDSNNTRKDFIVEQILKRINNDKEKTIGIYRIVSKKGINNYRSSAILDVALKIKAKGFKVVIYEPFAKEEVEGIIVEHDFNKFEKEVNIIVANRREEKISSNDKVYTVDVYGKY